MCETTLNQTKTTKRT